MVDDLMADLSDHCKISFTLPVMYKKTVEKKTQSKRRIPIKFKWDQSSKHEILNLLQQEQNKEVINKLKTSTESSIVIGSSFELSLTF